MAMKYTRIGNCPPFFCHVRSEYLFGFDQSEVGKFCEGIAIGLTVRKDCALAFSVLLKTGALWYDLPIHALCTRPCEPIDLPDSQPWDCLSDHFTVLCYDHLKQLQCYSMHPGAEEPCSYGFTVDYLDTFYAEDPGEHKTSNILFMDSGHIKALPNNKVRFVDKTFTYFEGSFPRYVRTKNIWYCEVER